MSVIIDTTSQKQAVIVLIKADQTPAEKLRRHAIGMMRELAHQYPKEYAEIGKEILPTIFRLTDHKMLE